MFIQILTDLYENGADFVDLSGETNDEGEQLTDKLKLTVKPEYVSNDNDDDVDSNFSDKDLDDLI